MIALALMVQITAYARPEGPTRLLIGMRSEATFAAMPGQSGFNSKPGYTFGPQIGFPLNKWFAIQTEVLYTSYGVGSFAYNSYGSPTAYGGNSFIGGGQFNQPYYGYAWGTSTSQQFLQIPVLARVSLGQIGPVKPVFYAGPMA